MVAYLKRNQEFKFTFMLNFAEFRLCSPALPLPSKAADGRVGGLRGFGGGADGVSLSHRSMQGFLCYLLSLFRGRKIGKSMK